MKIIISPAKKMNIDTDTFAPMGLPVFLSRTKELMNYMKGLSYEEAKKLWSCNDKITAQNFERYAQMNLERGLTPAILSYEGIQYQYMSPMVFSETALDYVQKNLRILSGFYGIVKPFDGVTPYRLEMQAKASIGRFKDLYEYWGDSLYQELTSDGDQIISPLAIFASVPFCTTFPSISSPKTHVTNISFSSRYFSIHLEYSLEARFKIK